MVAVEDESDASDIDLNQIRTWGEHVLAAEGYPDSAEASIVLVTNAVMADLNASALGADGPTDVLSFPIEQLTPGQVPDVEGPPIVIGDVFLCPNYIRQQAEDLGVNESDEFALLVTHGLLHCLGYDHVDDGDASLMEGRERDLLSAWGMTRR